MGEADITMEARLAAITTSLHQSRALLSSWARGSGVKEKEWKEATKASVATLTTSLFTPDSVREQPETKPSSPSFVSTHHVMGAGALHPDAAVTPTMPARCSTLGLTVNVGNNPAVLAFPTSGTTHLPAPTLSGNRDRPLHGAGGTGMNTPVGCSTDILTIPREGLVDGARAINTDRPRNNSFPRFDGTNPGLWREKCLEFFTKFNICKPFWTTAARMHMDGKAKEWFEAYRLRQVVGDWSQFMNTVEAYFDVGDSVDKISNDIYLKGSVWDGEIPNEVFTHVGGESLFVELDLDSTREVSKDMALDEELADVVLSQVGELSLCKDLNLDTDMAFEESVDKAEDVVDFIWVTPSLWNMALGVTPLSGQSVLAPGKSRLGGAHSLFDKVPPWENNAFGYGNFATQGDPLSLNKIPSWQRSAFSPGNSEIGAHCVFDRAPPWGTNDFQAIFFARQGDCLVLNQIAPWERSDFSLEKKGMERVHSVFNKFPSGSCDGFHPWRRNVFRTGNDKHLNIMGMSNCGSLLLRYGAWNYIRCSAEERIESTVLGHFSILQQPACCWEHLCNTYCLHFSLCDTAAVEANLLLKARLESQSTIKVATPGSCSLMNHMEYMDHAFLVFHFSPTWTPDCHKKEVPVSSMLSIKTRGGNLCIFLCQLLNEAPQAEHAYLMEDPLEKLNVVCWPHNSVSPRLIWSNFSLDENAENGIMLMGMNLYDHGYEFNLNQLSKIHVQLPWDPGEIQILFLPQPCARDREIPGHRLLCFGSTSLSHTACFWSRCVAPPKDLFDS